MVRASTPLLAAKYKLVGVAVLDVVEGKIRNPTYFPIIIINHNIYYRLHIRCASSHAQPS